MIGKQIATDAMMRMGQVENDRPRNAVLVDVTVFFCCTAMISEGVKREKKFLTTVVG